MQSKNYFAESYKRYKNTGDWFQVASTYLIVERLQLKLWAWITTTDKIKRNMGNSDFLLWIQRWKLRRGT